MKRKRIRLGARPITLLIGMMLTSFGHAQLPPWSLTVDSTGASNVIVTSSGEFGGTTRYTVTGIPDLTVVELQAPLTSGGLPFDHWLGCTGTLGFRGSTCNVNMTYDWSVIADYGYELTVRSSDANYKSTEYRCLTSGPSASLRGPKCDS